MLGHEFEVAAIVFRKTGEANIALREVDAAVTTQPAPGRLRLRDLDLDPLRGDFADDAADLAVVELHRVAG